MKTLPQCSWRPSLLATFILLFFGVSNSAVAQTSKSYLRAWPSNLAFPSTNIGTKRNASVTLWNSGRASLTISKLIISNSAFSVSGLSLPLTLGTYRSVHITVTFAPKANGSASGSLVFTSNANNSTLSFPVTGTGASSSSSSTILAPNPTSLSFGSIQVGSSKALYEVLQNTGTASVTISAATLTGSGFSFTGLTLPTTLAAGQSVTFPVTFAPASSGTTSGNIAVTSNAAAVNIPLSGTATALGSLAVSSGTLAFGNVNVGSSKSLSGTLTASGTSVTISSASTGSSEFVISGLTVPFTLGSGQSATYSITFTPQSSGSTSASASFGGNATNTATQTLTGTGVAVTANHSVKLAWTASTSSVVGYNIYRGTASGGPYTRVNSSVIASSTYTDSAVTSGSTYFYVVTAVISSGVESTYSNQVTAVVP